MVVVTLSIRGMSVRQAKVTPKVTKTSLGMCVKSVCACMCAPPLSSPSATLSWLCRGV